MIPCGPVGDDVVADVRRFNRRWTQVLGLLDEGLLATEHPLPEARVLYELAQRPDVERADLRATLAIDDSFLSRLLARLQRKRLITTESSPLDGRRRRIVLTPAGRTAARGSTTARSPRSRPWSPRSTAWVATPSPARWPRSRGFTGERSTALAVTLRDDVRPGDLGWVVQRNAEVYAAEFDWDQTYEAAGRPDRRRLRTRPRGRPRADVDRRGRRPRAPAACSASGATT